MYPQVARTLDVPILHIGDATGAAIRTHGFSTLKASEVRRSDRSSKSKVYHIIQIKHRDEVEAPITDWLQEAYELSDVFASKGKVRAKSKHKPKARRISPR